MMKTPIPQAPAIRMQRGMRLQEGGGGGGGG